MLARQTHSRLSDVVSQKIDVRNRKAVARRRLENYRRTRDRERGRTINLSTAEIGKLGYLSYNR